MRDTAGEHSEDRKIKSLLYWVFVVWNLSHHTVWSDTTSNAAFYRSWIEWCNYRKTRKSSILIIINQLLKKNLFFLKSELYSYLLTRWVSGVHLNYFFFYLIIKKKAFLYGFNDSTDEGMIGNGMRERGSDTQQRGRCSEDKASVHGIPAPPTELNGAPHLNYSNESVSLEHCCYLLLSVCCKVLWRGNSSNIGPIFFF